MAPLTSPSPELLRLGSGELFFDRWDEDGNPTGMRHLGNVETLEITLTDDKLVKKESMTRARNTYKSITRSRTVILRAVGDEWSVDNLALMLMGSLVYATAAATPVVDKVLYADVPVGTLGSILGGKFFFVGDLNVGTLTMDLGATALDADDFEVYNAQMGVVRIKETSTTATNGTDDLTVSYTPAAITGTASPVVRGGTETVIQGSVLFFEDNTTGENHILRVWSVSVTPDGALGLISDDFATFALNMEVQSDVAGDHGGTADDPLFHVQLVPAAA